MNTPINYHDFRKTFLEEVALRGLQLHSIQIRGLSPAGRPLFIDIAHSQFNSNLPTVIHFSGVHGIEGYIGSRIQSQSLRDLELAILSKVNVILVHATNPWGMSWYRRVNAHNVDLNRNFFPEGAERPYNAEFDVFAPIADKRPSKSKLKIYWKILRFLVQNGKQKALQAMAGGQYHLPESLSFGGQQVETEIQEICKFLKSTVIGDKPVYIIDVHSGLGLFGTENLLMDGKQDAKEKEFWLKLFPTALDPGTTEGFYSIDGSFSYALRDCFPKRQVNYIVEEFGTLPKMAVFRALVKEHLAYTKLKVDVPRSYLMIQHFYPYEKGWRIATMEKGKASLMRLLAAAAEV